MISLILRVGVLVSGSVVLLGGLYYLLLHGGEVESFHRFQGTAAADRIVSQIMRAAFALRARSIIQVGLLLLIATPILRVAFSLVGLCVRTRSRLCPHHVDRARGTALCHDQRTSAELRSLN